MVHVAFVLFSVLGGFLVLRWKLCALIHIPAVMWAALIEFCGWMCPLTPLENWLREKAGGSSYDSGFIEHYIIPVLYPASLTQNMQIVLGVFVLGINLVIYGWILHSTMKAGT